MIKRILFIAIVLLTGITSMQGQTLSVSNVTMPKNKNVIVTVDCDLDRADYRGFQFDLTFKKNGEITTDLSLETFINSKGEEEYCANLVFSAANFNLSSSYTENLYRFISYSMGDFIPENTKSLMTIEITSDGTLEVGNQYTATISGVVLTTDDGTQIKPDGSSFIITIGEPENFDIVLDEESTTAPEAASNVAVKVKRTIKSGSWSTICLPFAMTGDQVKDSFGNDVTLGDFCGYETSEDDDENIVGLVVKFNDVDINSGMEANHPYIIKVSSDINEFVVNKVDIVPEEEPTVAAVKRTKKQWSEFIGTYKANTIIEDDMLFISDGKFYYSTGKTKMKAFRAYFDFYDVLTEVEEGTSAARGITMSLGGINNGNGNGEGSGNGEGNGNGNGEGNGEGGTTGIDNVDSQATATGRVYTLSGQYKGDASQMESLPKGIYIVNGKKVVK